MCWILHSRTDIILWFAFINVLKGHEESCRAEPGPGSGTAQGVGNATGSWLTLMTAPAQGCHPLLSVLGEFWLPCSSRG